MNASWNGSSIIGVKKYKPKRTSHFLEHKAAKGHASARVTIASAKKTVESAKRTIRKSEEVIARTQGVLRSLKKTS